MGAKPETGRTAYTRTTLSTIKERRVVLYGARLNFSEPRVTKKSGKEDPVGVFGVLLCKSQLCRVTVLMLRLSGQERWHTVLFREFTVPKSKLVKDSWMIPSTKDDFFGPTLVVLYKFDSFSDF